MSAKETAGSAVFAATFLGAAMNVVPLTWAAYDHTTASGRVPHFERLLSGDEAVIIDATVQMEGITRGLSPQCGAMILRVANYETINSTRVATTLHEKGCNVTAPEVVAYSDAHTTLRDARDAKKHHTNSIKELIKSDASFAEAFKDGWRYQAYGVGGLALMLGIGACTMYSAAPGRR